MGVIYACNKDAQVYIISFIIVMSLFYYNGSSTVKRMSKTSVCQINCYVRVY